MHHKHNQIFTDHDIADDAIDIRFETKALSWLDLRLALSAAGFA